MNGLLTVRQPVPGYRHVTIDNPPLNLFDPPMVAALQQLTGDLEHDDTVKVVVFASADPQWFMAHIDVVQAGDLDLTPQPATGLASWPDIVVRLEKAPFLTVASIRGVARGVGSEFVLAMDVRFASRENSRLCQPEVGFGFIPGGGGCERLPLSTGRARALEIILGADDFDADLAERYGWINRAVPDADLDGFVDRFAARVATFDRAAISAAKRVVNSHGGLPDLGWIGATEREFYGLFATDTVQARMGRFLAAGLQQPGQFEADLPASIAGPAQ